ncbi:type III secretion system translocon subunit SctE [Hahella ganghwensis]|uniref:type III secretion system translocon subunit SctE n=1 Tax=Hahella ganghwensis TaxID=286420 RepID=UPI00035E653C|nr:type III secretion system translocon subunit SctE [Hahella ganghwensis]
MNTIGTYQPDSLAGELSIFNLLQAEFQGTKSSSRSDNSVTPLPSTGNTNTGSHNALVTLEAPDSSVDLMLMLQSLQVKMDEEGIKKGKEDAMILAQDNKERHKEVQEAIQKSVEEMEKAKKSGLFGKIFGWIAAAATLIAGAAMIATGAGAIAGGIMMALAVDQMVGMATGKSAVSELTNAIAKGLSKVMDEPANTIVASVIVTAIIIVGTAGAGYMATVSSSAGKAASTATTTFGKMANAIKESPTLHQARNAALFVSSGSQVGGATAGMDAAAHKKKMQRTPAQKKR